jgi:hypothetical protein
LKKGKYRWVEDPEKRDRKGRTNQQSMEGRMSVAEKYLKKRLASEEFRRAHLEEKVELDIECGVEELKRDIQGQKSADELIEKVEASEGL